MSADEEFTLKDWQERMAAQVRYRMKAMSLTVEDLSYRSGLPFDFVMKVVAGELYPSHKARSILGPILGCSLEFVEPSKNA